MKSEVTKKGAAGQGEDLDKLIAMPAEVVDAVIRNLARQPWADVNDIMARMQGLRTVGKILQDVLAPTPAMKAPEQEK